MAYRSARPLGAQRPRKVDVRVVAATNRNLMGEVDAGRFRRDLFYRLAAFPIHLPSLAERPMDVPAIAARLLADVNRAFHRDVPGFAAEAIAAMKRYDWPGNVRELANEIQRMVALSDDDGPLPTELLSARIRTGGKAGVGGGGEGERPQLKERVETLEREVIAEALDRLSGNISRVAAELGLSRVGLRAKIQRYDLRRDLDDDERD